LPNCCSACSSPCCLHAFSACFLASTHHPPQLTISQRADPSDLRQIPDNQEVFLSPTSDTSVILEVLGLVEEGAAATDLWEAAK
jgi:hypothetical protein